MSLLGSPATFAASSSTLSQAESFQKARPDQYVDLCQTPYSLDAQKFQEIGLDLLVAVSLAALIISPSITGTYCAIMLKASAR